jgi:ATP-dependent DNA ligase
LRQDRRPAPAGLRLCLGHAFDGVEALCTAVCQHELEVVAKRRSGRYVPGGRGSWVKTKNRDYWRYEMEREGALKVRRERQFH